MGSASCNRGRWARRPGPAGTSSRGTSSTLAPRPGAPTVAAVSADVLRPAGRRVRSAVAAVALVVLVVGALWGQDDDFPFGPFRMYATATKPTGVVATPFLWAVDANGREFEIKGAVFGLRPA